LPVRLTDTAIQATAKMTAATGKRKEMSDAVLPELRLRLMPSGTRSWVLACRDPEGRMRRFGLGNYPQIGISDARNAARRLRVDLKERGSDPIAEKRKLCGIGRDAEAGIGTLTPLLDHYESKGKPGEKLRSWKAQRKAIESVFERHLSRPLATMKALDLQTSVDAHKAEFAAALAVRCLRPILGFSVITSPGAVWIR
jgi:Arm DNA-binding domain